MAAVNRIDFCALPYYRPNLWNGAACKPALLQVGEGRVRVFHHDGRLLFDDRLTDVRCRVTALGTLKLRVRGTPFAFYGRGGAISPGPETGQATYVREFWANNPPYPQLRDTLLTGRPTQLMKGLCQALIQGGARPGR